MEKNNIVEWDNRYTVGIQLIDDQHKELLRLINCFYLGCINGEENTKSQLRLSAHGLVGYIKYHFATEEQFLERIKYPDRAAHKRQHDEFIRETLERAEHFDRSRAASPKNFVRYIRNWILAHITLIDKKYATYIYFINGQINAAGRELYEVPAMWRAGPQAFIGSKGIETPSEIFLG
ncbi:MAG: bacteriohemerythrin [Treponema sp.]|jgi:hemerythrin|nr:bacteriohemerythrin [Treponema sp.]